MAQVNQSKRRNTACDGVHGSLHARRQFVGTCLDHHEHASNSQVAPPAMRTLLSAVFSFSVIRSGDLFKNNFLSEQAVLQKAAAVVKKTKKKKLLLLYC